MKVHLQRGETLIHELRQSPRHALNIALLVGSLSILPHLVVEFVEGGPVGGWAWPTWIAIGAVIGIGLFLGFYRCQEFTLTSNRLFLSEGHLKRRTGQYALCDILSVEDGLPGSFLIKTGDGAVWKISGLPNQARVQKNLVDAIAG